MMKNISCAFAAFLIFGLVSVNAYGANATDTTNNRTIGGYVYSLPIRLTQTPTRASVCP